jgi:molecular chaperone GrpE (heat shock protein)
VGLEFAPLLFPDIGNLPAELLAQAINKEDSMQFSPKATKPKKTFHDLKSRIVGILTYEILPRKAVEERKQIVSESTRIDKRMDELEKSIAQLDSFLTQSVHHILKIQQSLAKKMIRSNGDSQKALQRELAKLTSKVDALTKQAGITQEIAISKVSAACGQLSGIDGTLGGMRDYLAKSTESIRRYQEGYDFQILKNFVRQIARAIADLERNLLKVPDEAKPALIEAKEDLLELLYRNGVEPIVPETGASYRGMEGYAEVSPEKVPATDLAQRGNVAEVTRPGYRYTFDTDNGRVIQSAMVKLYE